MSVPLSVLELLNSERQQAAQLPQPLIQRCWAGTRLRDGQEVVPYRFAFLTETGSTIYGPLCEDIGEAVLSLLIYTAAKGLEIDWKRHTSESARQRIADEIRKMQ